jgi:lipopolysaccharide/colanic/teichoic acid biosynthesis glycosyltransferase
MKDLVMFALNNSATENALPEELPGADGATVLVRAVQGNWYVPLKTAVEFVAALGILVLTAPTILVCALLVRLTSRGPAFYSQLRLGQFGRPYRIYKLRTMYHNCESSSGPKWSQVGDPRITPLGRFLRRTHLDELPQLLNVLRGDMALVGPRPERPEFVPTLEEALPLYRGRLLVRPGVTGLAQLQLPPDTDLESVRRKLAYDLCYVQTAGLWLDLRLVAGTALLLLGASCPFLRAAFSLPSQQAVERGYRELLATRGAPVPSVQPQFATTP